MYKIISFLKLFSKIYFLKLWCNLKLLEMIHILYRTYYRLTYFEKKYFATIIIKCGHNFFIFDTVPKIYFLKLWCAIWNFWKWFWPIIGWHILKKFILPAKFWKICQMFSFLKLFPKIYFLKLFWSYKILEMICYRHLKKIDLV